MGIVLFPICQLHSSNIAVYLNTLFSTGSFPWLYLSSK